MITSPRLFATTPFAVEAFCNATMQRRMMSQNTSIIFKRYVSQAHDIQFITHKFSVEEAAKRFLSHDQKRLFRPLSNENNLLEKAFSRYPLKKVLLPLYKVDAVVQRTKFEGAYGRYDSRTIVINNKVQTQRYIKWFPISGDLPPCTYQQENEDMTIYGGLAWNPAIIEQAMSQQYDKDKLQLYDKKIVPQDIEIDPMLKRTGRLNEIALKRIDTHESVRAKQKIAARVWCDCTRVHRVEVQISSLKLSPYFFPSYILQYHNSSPRVVPAFCHSTKVVGMAAISPEKVMTLALAVSTAASFLVPAFVPVRVSFIVISSVVSALGAKYSPSINHSWHQRKIRQEKEKNDSVAETAIDRLRRIATEGSLPPKPSDTFSKGIEADYKVLDLDPSKEITEEMVRKAFRKKISIVHPDRKTGSAKQSRQANIARDMILKVIHTNNHRNTERSQKRHYSTSTLNVVKEPPRSTYDLRAATLIKVVLQEKDYSKALQLVEEQGIHLDSHDKAENTLLAEAAKRGDLQAVCFAIDKLGASPDSSCDCPTHRTALHYAIEKGHRNVIQALLERKASPNLINSYGETPLDIAADKAMTEVQQLLRSYGAVTYRKLQGKMGLWKKNMGLQLKRTNTFA